MGILAIENLGQPNTATEAIADNQSDVDADGRIKLITPAVFSETTLYK